MMQTPHGLFNGTNIEEYQIFSGTRFRDGKYSILAENVTVPKWKKDQAGKNIEEIGEHVLNIAIRFYNFKYALWKTNWDFDKAIEWVKKNAFENGKPIYLPKQLEITSYKKLLADVKEPDISELNKKKDIFEKQ